MTEKRSTLRAYRVTYQGGACVIYATTAKAAAWMFARLHSACSSWGPSAFRVRREVRAVRAADLDHTYSPDRHITHCIYIESDLT